MTSRIFLQDSNDVGFKAFAAATLAAAPAVGLGNSVRFIHQRSDSIHSNHNLHHRSTLTVYSQ